jgi:hypothetical protein
MLSEQEQQALLAEFKIVILYWWASKKQIKFSEELQIYKLKERIADDDFADFRQGKLPARSLGEICS